MNGRFITIEGFDGAGKTTQSRLLKESLENRGFKTLLTREPGGSHGAERIRQLLVDRNEYNWSDFSEVLLFSAARRDHLEKRIAPALSEGKIVICDRFVDSTRVYQSLDDRTLRHKIDDIHNSMVGIDPDLTFILTISEQSVVQRIEAREDGDWRVEKLEKSKLLTAIEEFEAICDEFPDRCRLVDSSRNKAETAQQILDETLKLLMRS